MKIENRGLGSWVLGLRPLISALTSFDTRSVKTFSTFFIKTKEQSPKTKDQKPNTCCPNLQFSFFSFHFSIPFLALCSLLFALTAAAQAQTIPDKMVASVTNGSRATPDLIT